MSICCYATIYTCLLPRTIIILQISVSTQSLLVFVCVGVFLVFVGFQKLQIKVKFSIDVGYLAYEFVVQCVVSINFKFLWCRPRFFTILIKESSVLTKTENNKICTSANGCSVIPNGSEDLPSLFSKSYHCCHPSWTLPFVFFQGQYDIYWL